MLLAVDKKYCYGDTVQIMPFTDEFQLIVEAGEILLLKIKDSLIINKYRNHPNRKYFPSSEREQDDVNHVTQIYDLNKLYLNFTGSISGVKFKREYMFRGTGRALFMSRDLKLNDRDIKQTEEILTRAEIENYFNPANYDILAVLDTCGRCLALSSKKDNFFMGKNIIPSDEEIVQREYDSRKGDFNIVRMLNDEIPDKDIERKTIDEIEEFQILGPVLFSNYVDMILTSKDGKFSLKWFKIDFVEEDTFRLTTSVIDVIEPTVDDLAVYLNGKIKETLPPKH